MYFALLFLYVDIVGEKCSHSKVFPYVIKIVLD